MNYNSAMQALDRKIESLRASHCDATREVYRKSLIQDIYHLKINTRIEGHGTEILWQGRKVTLTMLLKLSFLELRDLHDSYTTLYLHCSGEWDDPGLSELRGVAGG